MSLTIRFKCGEGVWKRNSPMISKDEASKPTKLQPGSEDKQLLMIARSFYGLPIFHPKDLKHAFHSSDNTGDKANVRTSIDVRDYTSLDDI